jgi:hypothetical protein
MTTLGSGRDRQTDWKVTAVFDPDGGGQDFAYTVGLHDRGLPELHLWARPSLGDDPGADWKFSPHDCGRILNELAWQLIDGTVAVGDTWELSYDDGMVTARYRLDPPGDRNELEAFLIAPGALVLPVRWSLHRRPIGKPRPLSKRGLQRATAEYADLLVGLDEPVLPDGWVLPPAFVPGGPFGPLTPMVAGRVAEFWSADGDGIFELHRAAVTMVAAGGITWPVAVADALARELGRVEEAGRTQAAARELVDARMLRPDWAAIERDVAAAFGISPDEPSPEWIRSAVRGNLTELLWTVLVTEVIADRLTSAHRLQGRGAWLTGLAPVGDLPGPQWRAPRRVLDRLYAALRPLSLVDLLELVVRHDDDELEDYGSLSYALQGGRWSRRPGARGEVAWTEWSRCGGRVRSTGCRSGRP